MIKNFQHYFIPVFLVLYFLLAFMPILAYQEGEIFPFFSFKLYSKVPNDFIKYDILYNKGEMDAYFLLHKNSTLNKLEIKNFMFRVSLLGERYEELKQLFLNTYFDLVSTQEDAWMVKISGDYVEALRDNKYDVEIL